jgi:uncharacterized RDD family membrane protein YckC
MNPADSFQGPVDHRLTIRTPEGIAFSLPLAGPFSRFVAWLVDISCLALGSKLASIVTNLLGLISLDLSRAISLILFFAISIGYAIACEWYWQGQTLGKRVMGLRVMDIHGLRLRFSQVVIRNLLRTVDSLPLCYLLGGVVLLASRQGQRLGDLAGNTVVAATGRLAEPRLDRVLDETHYNSLRAHPHLAARLRQRIGPAEAELGLRALLRREDLEPEARVALFKSLASHYKRRVPFPEEDVSTISDEQYVRNVVDVLFRK